MIRDRSIDYRTDPRHVSVDFQTQYIVGNILSWSKRACFVFVNRTRNGQTAAVRSLPTHRIRDWPKTEAALKQSYRLSKVQDKRAALEALTSTKNKTKCRIQHTIVCLLVLRWKRGRELVHCLYKKLLTCRILFVFQLGKAKENAKLLTCCLKKQSS